MVKILFLILVIQTISLTSNVFAEVIPYEPNSSRTSTNRLIELGLSENCTYEPIFRGVACIYEINKNAKQTVVLVHGLNSRAESWLSQIAVLKEKYHVISFDLPGFGKSSRGNQLYSPTNYAKFIHFVTEKYAARPFYLIGHSMGGAISLRYVDMYPDDVKRLILADVGGVLHQYSFAKSIAFKWLKTLQEVTYWAIPGLQSSLEDLPSIHEMMNMVFQNLEWLPIDIRDALNIPELRAIILNGNSIPIAGAAVSTEDLTGAIRNNKVPTLIVWGAYDLVTPIRTGKILQVRMPKTYLKILPRSAHSPMVDQPSVFNKLMLTHMNAYESELDKKFWKFPVFKRSKKIGYCRDGEEKIFEGNYLRIELNTCKRALIRNSSIGSIVAKNSNIEIIKSQIVSKDIGMILFDSTLDITSSNITANIGIQSVRSHLDIAGTDFKINSAAINNLGQSDAVFSVSTVNGLYRHAYKDFTLAGKI